MPGSWSVHGERKHVNNSLQWSLFVSTDHLSLGQAIKECIKNFCLFILLLFEEILNPEWILWRIASQITLPWVTIQWTLQDHQWVVSINFYFLSMWDIVSTEFLWTSSIQVSKNTTTKNQTAGASNKTFTNLHLQLCKAWLICLFSLEILQKCEQNCSLHIHNLIKLIRVMIYVLTASGGYNQLWVSNNSSQKNYFGRDIVGSSSL